MDSGYIGYLDLEFIEFIEFQALVLVVSVAYLMPRNWCVLLVRCVLLPPTGACDSGGPTNRAHRTRLEDFGLAARHWCEVHRHGFGQSEQTLRVSAGYFTGSL
jgi:hypothetical protein